MRPSRYADGEKGLSDTLYQETTVFDTAYDPAAGLSSSPLTEIDMVVKGSGVHRFFGQSVPCAEGDVCIVQENVPHGFFAADEKKDGSLTVRRLFLRVPDWLEGDAASPENPSYCFGVFKDGSTIACALLNQNDRAETAALADRILEETQAKRYEWKKAVRASLSLLLITVSRCIRSALQTTSDTPPKDRGIILSVLRTVDEHFGETDLTLERIAAAHYMSTSVISRLFGQYMGQPFSEFIRNYRMDQACRMLRETDEPVSAVARRCGIRDIPSFYRAFGGYTDMTPGQYRRQYKDVFGADRTKEPLDAVASMVEAGKAKDVTVLVTEALEKGIEPARVMNEGLVAGMTRLGEKFRNGEAFVPEVLMASRAMNVALSVLRPALQRDCVQPLGRAVICTVKGDMHDIGKNMVRMMLEGKGIECIDLGVDVSPASVAEAVRTQKPDLVCLSSLLTTTMPGLGDVICALRESGLRDRVTVMVGGAPVTQAFADEIGADLYTKDASSAAEAAALVCAANRRDK